VEKFAKAHCMMTSVGTCPIGQNAERKSASCVPAARRRSTALEVRVVATCETVRKDSDKAIPAEHGT